MRSRLVYHYVLVAVCLVTASCGSSSSGPARYQLSGVVKFDGKPIPVGFIYFNPDTSKGNSGPGSGAEIKNGQYTTPRDGGIIGGPMIVKIDGYDGISKDLGGEVVANGSALFEAYETRVDFEKKNGKKDFEFDKAGTGSPQSFDPTEATRH
jgi:hypothetical protein